MTLYAFILGRKQMLSVAELVNVIGITGKIIDITPEALIASFEQPLSNEQKSLDRLGGAIKIAEIFAEDSDKSKITELISGFLAKNSKDSTDKLLYAISVYNFEEKPEIILQKILNGTKKSLTDAEIKSRYINKYFTNPETAAIKGEKLLQKGAEIIAVQGTHRIFLGKTVALQDIESYTKRDYGRPFRDPRLGMLPPKLAQILINLSGATNILKSAKEEAVIFDPFVGLGTVLAEGLLMGFSVVGSDIEQKVLDKAQKNLSWIRNQTTNNIIPEQTFRLFHKDATALSAQDLPEKIDLIVTESYLGPPITNLPSPEEIKKTHAHLRETMVRFFASLKLILAPGTPVVICLPAYHDNNRYISLENLTDLVSGHGFRPEPLIPNKIAARFGLKMPASPSLIYDRPDQIVAREIWKFVKTP
jgi:tRNA (guanine10-N2)-dimethyltransferase